MSKNGLEWSVFAIAGLLVAATIGFLVHAAVTGNGRPAMLSVAHGASRRAPGGYAMPITVTNRGDRTAERVRVEIVAQRDTAEQTAEIEFEFLPRGSRRTGWVVFEEDPARSTITTHVKGFEAP